MPLDSAFKIFMYRTFILFMYNDKFTIIILNFCGYFKKFEKDDT